MKLARFFSTASQKYTIETDELAELIETSPDALSIVNATWYFGEGTPDPKEVYEKAHIPNDAYFSISEIADKSTGFLGIFTFLNNSLS